MILVTGGTGLVGSHLLYHLTQKEEPVRAVYRREGSFKSVKRVFSYYTDDVEHHFSKIEWVQADITEVPSMIPVFEGATHVYHCAALISFDPSDYIEMRKVNIHGTAIIVNLSIDAGVKKMCFVSSIAAIGDDAQKGFIDEENEWNDNENNHGYAITKYGAEMEVWRASKEGMDVVIVNPGVILGSGFWDSGSGKLFSQVYKGLSFYSEGITGFIGVEDVAQMMIGLMESRIRNERFILVSENKSFQEVLFAISDALGKKRPSKKVKQWQTALFWRWEWLLSKLASHKPRITKHSAKSLFSKTIYHSDKIKQNLHINFQNIDKVINTVANHFLKDKKLL